jgi:hypothetical protein
MKLLKLLFLLPIIALSISACNKDEEVTFSPDANLNFSTDSVLFDTVFTSIGSTVRRFKIFNYNEKAINIERLRIGGGANSSFSINVAGKPILDGYNVKINGNDSVNVLVRVNINPDANNQTFIVEDSILLDFNGKKEKIALVAYGQNANFIKNQQIASHTVWDSGLPYIIYNEVTVNKDVNLTIAPGTRVLFHNGATMNVKGTLIAEGTKKDTILFASDRTERIYEEEPGQWNGLHFFESSKNNVINHATIKNGIAGITLDSLSTTAAPKLILANSVIKNMQVVGVLAYHADLAAFNNLFYNCGQYLIYGIGGGRFDLVQNTFAAYNFNYARRTPALLFSDYISATSYNALSVTLTNNILWGTLDDELMVEKKSTLNPNLSIRSNILKTSQAAYSQNNNILGADPLFINPRQGNYKIKDGSPAIAKGEDLNTNLYFTPYLSKDIKEEERLFPSSLGCYEKK